MRARSPGLIRFPGRLKAGRRVLRAGPAAAHREGPFHNPKPLVAMIFPCCCEIRLDLRRRQNRGHPPEEKETP